MFQPKSLGFVLNPAAGRRRAIHWEAEIHRAMKSSGLGYSILYTTRPNEAGPLGAALSREHDAVVAVGGDGTVHEVAQGLIAEAGILGVIPSGSGNDFNRMAGMPSRIPAAVDVLISASSVRRTDVGYLVIRERNNDEPITRYFVNSAGFGFDAAVADRRSRIPLLRGLPLYVASAVWTLSDYGNHRFTMTLDGRPQTSFSGLMVALGIGRFEGGGFKVFPDASPEDGLFELCAVGAMPMRQSLPLLGKAVFGAHMGHRSVQGGRLRAMTLESEDPFAVHADGEVISTHAVRVSVTCQPGQISVVAPVSPIVA